MSTNKPFDDSLSKVRLEAVDQPPQPKRRRRRRERPNEGAFLSCMNILTWIFGISCLIGLLLALWIWLAS